MVAVRHGKLDAGGLDAETLTMRFTPLERPMTDDRAMEDRGIGSSHQVIC